MAAPLENTIYMDLPGGRVTIELRPDLIAARGGLSPEERGLLERELGITYPADSPEAASGDDAP